jgi:uncharacterized protein (UPF0335 family)
MSETPEQGHNEKGQLRSLVERVENLETSLRDLQADRSDLYKEAAGNGFNVPAIKAIVRARRETAKQKAKREERETHEELYRGELGAA